jgi:hypothetical protein
MAVVPSTTARAIACLALERRRDNSVGIEQFFPKKSQIAALGRHPDGARGMIRNRDRSVELHHHAVGGGQRSNGREPASKITPAKLLAVTARSTTSQTVDAGRILKCVVPYRLLRDNLSPA